MPLEVVQGKSALILAMPYTGTNMQPALVDRLIHKDRWLTAPDRSLDRLLGGLFEDVSLVRANFHRYLSDADVPSPKYARKPVQGMIGTVPVLDRSGLAIWTHPPSEQEAMGWHSMWYAPYHAAVAAQIARVRASIGHAVLVTCRAKTLKQSTLFEKPVDIKICTHFGASSDFELSTKLYTLISSSQKVSGSLSGNMESGWATQHYGRPAGCVHALDLEISEESYLSKGDTAGQLDVEKSASLRDVLGDAFEFLACWRPDTSYPRSKRP